MEELDLKDLLILFWRKKIQIILIIAIFIGLGVIYTGYFLVPKYTSSTTLVLATEKNDTTSKTTGVTSTDSSITTTDLTINSKLVSTYSELVKSKTVLRKVINNLGMDIDETQLRNNIKVSSVKDTELIEISVTDTNAEYAAKIANQIAIVFTEEVKEIYNINNVYVVDEAETQEKPSNINYIKDISIAAIIGLVVAILDILINNMLDTTIKTEEDIEKYFSLPVLSSIPLDCFDNKKGGRN